MIAARGGEWREARGFQVRILTVTGKSNPKSNHWDF